MPRRKTLSDEQVMGAALERLQADGPDALTFAGVAAACGLAPATLVQRFGTRGELKRRTLHHAWDRLDARTAALSASMPPTPRGAIDLLVALSEAYGDIGTYADGLLMLREDLRDPELRARGAAWMAALVAALDRCFADDDRPIGDLMAAHWQGSLLWWSFDPREPLSRHVAGSLEQFVRSVVDAERGDQPSPLPQAPGSLPGKARRSQP